jgi:hypothetical protein
MSGLRLAMAHRNRSPEKNMKNQIPEFAVGWGTLALINAGLAQAKNRSGLAWFLASLFLGPLATLIIVLLDKVGPSDPTPGRKPFDLEDYRKQ